MKHDAPKGFIFLPIIPTNTGGNSGFTQRGNLSFIKTSSCLEVSVTFDTLKS